MQPVVKETADTFGRTRKEIAIRQDLAQNLFAIEADEDQIEQVLLDLYVNAAEAMSTCADGAAGRPGGGDLVLKTTNVTHIRVGMRDIVPKDPLMDWGCL